MTLAVSLGISRLAESGMLFADYDDATGTLRYVNCGHLPPLLLRANGSGPQKSCTIERLSTSTTVLDLFESSDGIPVTLSASPGDHAQHAYSVWLDKVNFT